jgi:cellulose synthase/poly-beta-1,6-N-acetylglucosamine synthase-like glycosyltransferase
MSLADAFVRASPRLSPRRASFTSYAIYLSVALLFPLLLACALLFDNLFAWSVGIVYIVYDIALMLFIVRQASRASSVSAPREPYGRPTLGVIVAAHDEAAALPDTIDALLRQNDPPDLIVIADDGSTDGTAQLLHERYGLSEPVPGSLSRASDPRLRWLRLPRGGKAAALNAAIVHADTTIVLTVDADTRLEAGAIAAIRAAFANEESLVAAGGILVPVCSARGIAGLLGKFQTYEYVRNIVGRFAWMHAGTLLLVSGAFGGFRRDALIAVGGFDARSLVEDYEVVHRLHRYAGEHGLCWRVRVVGDALARTEAPHGLVSFLRQRRRWFAGFLQTQGWNRDMTGEARFGRLGTSLLPVKVLDTLQPIYGLTAVALLIVFAAHGRTAIVVPALALFAAKIAADIAFNRWAIRAYRRLTADRAPLGFRVAEVAPVVEPFSFQLLRQAGAAWGWLAFLTGELHWGKRNRRFVAAARNTQSVTGR